MEEQELIEMSVKGDSEAFAALMGAYYERIYAFAYKWTRNQQDAEDVAQEVCIKIGRSITRFRMDSKFSTWVYRIVVNASKDLLAKKKFTEDVDEVPLGDDETPELVAERNQLWREVSKLPDKQREAVLLVYAEGLSHSEVADIMECKESTVSWYVHEAKKQLKDLVSDYGR